MDRNFSSQQAPQPRMAYAQGGAIDTEESSVDPMGAMNGAGNLSQALASVQSALAFGRKLHGLGGEEEGGAVQTADRMPAVPGNQSESGVARPQPMPGPLPPTNNPFGKRAEAEPDGDEGAIDTDEDMA